MLVGVSVIHFSPALSSLGSERWKLSRLSESYNTVKDGNFYSAGCTKQATTNNKRKRPEPKSTTKMKIFSFTPIILIEKKITSI